jgi:methylmalonyl-CoA mutase cobalamin-binding domain/chain
MDKRLRVVVAKPGMDGHDRGAKVIARALRDAGMEVIYTGIFQTSASIVEVVLQEDADVLGISLLSGAHVHYAQEIGDLLRQNGLGDVLFLLGGTIPKQDAETVKQHGVAEVFGPGTPTRDIVDYIRRWDAARTKPG